MKNLRWLLFPFAILYGIVIAIRNWLYDAGLKKGKSFGIPVICVGNLEVGGAGKSPMTEYLVRLLKKDHHLATLSRGYGRSTKGFKIAAPTDTAAEIGDEPAQFKHKFPDVTVAVCENRVEGISQLIKSDHDLVILDDGFQHRAVKPGFSIVLFDYNHLQQPHLLLPAGNYRDTFSSRWRAEVLIVSKCPDTLNNADSERAINRLKPLPWQHVFFTKISYQPLKKIESNETVIIDNDTTVFVLTGIANPKPMLDYIGTFTSSIVHHKYPDHHRFSLKNISKLAAEFADCPAQKKLIVTTEKDAQRLVEQDVQEPLKKLPVFVLPIAIEFLNNGHEEFNKIITDNVREYTTDHQVH